MGEVARMEAAGARWEEVCLGSFYIKPNYPGRSSHVCNGGFLVTEAARNRGVGRLMGEGYLEWAPKLVCLHYVLDTRLRTMPLKALPTDLFRAIPTAFSTWFMRQTSLRVEYGTLWASSG